MTTGVSTLFEDLKAKSLHFQDYVSDVTSKYLPTSHSPWQVHVITLSPPRNFYLVRVHHLLLRQEQLALGDFLPLNRAPWSPDHISSPFSNLYAPPSALPRLHQKLTESFSNVWNEFLCNNDPTERPELLKKRISLCQCAKIYVIVYFSSVKEITRCPISLLFLVTTKMLRKRFCKKICLG